MRRMLAHRLYAKAMRDPRTIDDAVRACLGRFRPEVVHAWFEEAQRVRDAGQKDATPLEVQYSAECWRALMQSVTAERVVTTQRRGQFGGKKCFLDLHIYGELNWGVELMRNGTPTTREVPYHRCVHCFSRS